MLTADFFNVGDGDAILLRERRPGEPDFTVMVDTGRPFIEFVKGSLRREAIAHLMKAGVDHIDLMVLTHLHFDHIGGALRIARRIPVKRLLTGYLPCPGARWIVPKVFEEKPAVGLCEALNLLLDIVDCAEKTGCACVQAEAGAVSLTDSLSMDVSLPDADLLSRQKAVCDELYRGENPDYERLYRVSKNRNCSSLITRFHYAGKSILLTGDSYARYWEDRAETRCDILKVPHHGDKQSMTPALLKKLSPAYAVISCQNNPSPDKERPAAGVMDLLQRDVPRVLCTENCELPGYGASSHESVRFHIYGDGQIDCLDGAAADETTL